VLHMRTLLRGAATAAGVLILAFGASNAAADILDDWANVKAPPAPELKEVKLDGATTAIIIMDMNQMQCAEETRCSATAPAIKRLHDGGRAAGAMFWYSVPGENSKPSDVDQVVKGVTPRDGEWERINGPDKFRGSSLEDKLKAHNIKTAIICGHSFQGVGIGTGSGLAVRGYNVIVPVDCLASNSNDPNVLYLEQYSVWHLAKAANGVANRVTLTRSTMVKW
jgi:nicotinamidase-related amidase